MSATSGCVLFLVDESAAMSRPMADGHPPRLQMIATGINGLIKSWSGVSNAAVGVLGYHSVSGTPEVVSRWAGSWAGRDLVPLQELAASPARVEQRVRKLPSPNPLIPPVEQAVDFPVWYEPGSPAGEACQQAVFQQAQQMVENWLRDSGGAGQAIVVHIFSSASTDGNPGKIIQGILQSTAGNCQVWNLHLGLTANIPPTLYPSTKANLPLGTATDWFDRSSKISDVVLAGMKQQKLRALPGARALICNATALEVFQALQVLKQATDGWQGVALTAESMPIVEATPVEEAPAVETSNLFGTAEPVGETEEVTVIGDSPEQLVVLLLDRSTVDPYASVTVWNKIQDRANDLLSQAIKAKNPDTQIAVVLYGGDDSHQAEVMSGFQGELGSHLYANATELDGKALRIHEFDEEIPNGVGGLLTLHRQRHIFVEVEPKAACSPQSAVDAVLNTIQDWRGKYRGAARNPVIIHLTRGGHAPQDMSAWGQLSSATLYHWLFTECATATVAYPDTAESITAPELQGYFYSASPLAEMSARVGKLPKLSPQARGLVVNGKFEFSWPTATT